MRLGIFIGVLLVATLCLSVNSYSQLFDPTFKPTFAVDDWVSDIVAQPDGKLIVTGRFAAYGAGSGKIARLNTDGTFDSSFNPGTGFNGYVGAVAIQPDGKIVVGGQFTEYNGTPAKSIIRLNQDGSVDDTFATGTALSGSSSEGINDLVIDAATGKIYAGGVISEYNDMATRLVIRLLPTGQLDESFEVAEVVSGRVNVLALQSDGKLVMAGRVATGGKYGVIRLNTDGTLDSNFALSSTSISEVFALTIQPDDKILAGGDFTNFDGSTAPKYLVRLQKDGVVDSEFNPDIRASSGGIGPYHIITDIKIQDDQKIVVAGDFTSHGTAPLNDIVRLNVNGELDFAFGACAGFNYGGVSVVHIQPDGKIVGGGYFESFEYNENIHTMVRFVANPGTIATPVAAFGFIASGQTASFSNASTGANHYEWSFGNGKYSSVSNPVHTYSSGGNFNVTLSAYGHCDQKATATKSVQILSLERVYPTSGGNTGKTTVTVFGYGFTDNSTLSLVGNGTTIAASGIRASTDGLQLSGVFDLRDLNLSAWDVRVTNNTGTRTLAAAFQVEAGSSPEVRVEIVGRDQIRRNVPQEFQVRVFNPGNVDVHGIPVFITFKGDTAMQIVPGFTPVAPGDDDEIDYAEMSPFVKFDSLGGEPVTGLMCPLIVPHIPANGSVIISNTITTDKSVTAEVSAGPEVLSLDSGNPDEDERLLHGSVGDCVKLLRDDVIPLIFPGRSDIKNCSDGIVDASLGVLANLADTPRPGQETYQYVSIFFAAVRDLKPCAPLIAKALRVEVARRALISLQGVAYGFGKLDSFENFLRCSAYLTHKVSTAYKNITAVNSFDPNEKLGPTNNPFNHYIKGDQPISYQINFENLSSATAPAQVVTIIDTLDSNVFDFSTFQWTSVGFGKTYKRNAQAGSSAFATLVDMRPGTNLLVKIDATFAAVTGVVTTKYVSLNPSTLELTDDPVAGFLPPNVDAGDGEGYVVFSIAPKPELAGGTVLNNRAHIYFDANEPIITNTFTNMIDKTGPASKVAKAELLDDDEVLVTLQGTDLQAGVRGYDVYLAVDDAPFELLLRDVSIDQFTFPGVSGSTYHLYSVAKDYAGNQEAAKSAPEASLSLITTAVEHSSRGNGLTIYPAPARHEAFVNLTLSRPQHVTITIHDSRGAQLGRAYYQLLQAGEHRLSIPLQGLATGMYWSRISSVEINSVQKLIVVSNQ